jgi:hypothetical protein
MESTTNQPKPFKSRAQMERARSIIGTGEPGTITQAAFDAALAITDVPNLPERLHPPKKGKATGPKMDAEPADAVIITAIAARAMAIAEKNRQEEGGPPPEFDGLDINMDITAAHLNGNPLRLEALLAADDFNFVHDVFGIRRHLDRKTGKLGDCFLPRFSGRG